MKKDVWKIEGTNVQQLHVRRYENELGEATNGVIQILHGMADYGDRYDTFAKFLCDKGYIVYIHDHRKHGYSISETQKVGYYDTDTWAEMVADIDCVQREILAKENVKKVIMIGHSMGSFLLRNYLIDYGNNVEKAVIMGTGSTDVVLSKIGILLGKLMEKIAPNKPNDFLNTMSVGQYSKVFEPNRTGLEWLTRDEEIVDFYVASPLCGYSYTPRFYTQIASGVVDIVKESRVKQTPKIPLFFISGEKDPVGKQGVGVKKVYTMYTDFGYDTRLKLYPDARHEILNELNKEEVFDDILGFIEG